MRRKIIRYLFLGLMLAVFVLVFTNSTVWTKGNVITTGPIDSQLFQALVDSAVPHTTIKCLGGVYPCYQGSETFPIRITKPLRIVAVDENDPPIFMGTGTFGDLTPFIDGNNGFIVYNLTSDIKGLEFVGLHFWGFDRSVAFSPNYDPVNPTVPAPGVLSNLRVDSCQFDNCLRGVQVFGGQTENFVISFNNINVQKIGIIVLGGASWIEDVGYFDVGRSKNCTIRRNIVSGSRNGIMVDGCERAFIRDNFVENSAYYGIAFGDEYALDFPDDGPIRIGSVQGNEIHNAWVGIDCFGPTSLHKSLVQSNFLNNCEFGVVLEQGANRFNIVNNEFVNSEWSDIWLGIDEINPWTWPPESHDNTVIATDFVTTVVDNGINNKLVGTLAMIYNPGVPDDVRQKLEELRLKLAERMQR